MRIERRDRSGFGVTSRRRLLTGAALLTAGVRFDQSRPARAQSATPPASPVAGTWGYTDLLGTTVTLPQRPARVAAAINVAAALHDFGIVTPIVFGWTASNHPDGDHVAWGNIDPRAVEVVSNTEGNVELEPLLAAQPDLIVSWLWDKNQPDDARSGLPAEIAAELAAIAPVVILNQGDPNEVELGRIADFAAALGADLATPDLVAARQAYETKRAEVQTVAAARSDLTVLFASFGTGPVYVASPDFVADLGQARALGLTLANDGSPTATTYFEELSAEAALTYPSDVLYIDQYGPAQTLEALQALPAVNQHPAVRAGQAGPWPRDLPLSYPGLTTFLESLLVPLRTAEKVS